VEKLEGKLERIEFTVNDIKQDMTGLQATLKERENSEKLRNDILEKNIEIQEKRVDADEKRIEKLEANQRWVVVTVFGSLIIAILSTILK